MKSSIGNPIKRLDEFIRMRDNLNEKVYYVVVVIVMLVAIASFLGTVLFKMSSLASLCMIAIFIHSVVFFALGKRFRRFDLDLAIFCMILCCILMPVAFFCDAGLYAGMPLFCMGCLLLCTFNPNRTYRIMSFSAALAVFMVVFMLSIAFPDSAFRLNMATEDAHIAMSFAGVSIMVLIVCSIVLSEFANYQFTNDLLGRHMDVTIKESLFSRMGNVEGDYSEEECDVAVAFIDLCGFTSRTENLDPKQVTEYLNLFFDIADESIHEHHGILDKFMGDCVMAFWVEKPGENIASLNACRTAIDVREKVNDCADEVYERFGCEIALSVGIGYGRVVLGDVGSHERKDYTIVGDVVNVAARLEDTAMKNDILIDNVTCEKLAGRLKTELHTAAIPSKGRRGSFDAYSLMGGEAMTRTFVTSASNTQTGFVFEICGCRGSFSVSGQRFACYGGETSCYLFKKDAYALVVDCGSGLQRARKSLQDCTKIDVFLTHVHYDHLVGLLDWTVFPKEAEITFYGWFDKWHGEDTLRHFLRFPFWPVDLSRGKIVSVDDGEKIALRPDLSMEFYASNHPDNTLVTTIDVAGKRVCMLFDCEDPSVLPESAAYNCEMILYDGTYSDDIIAQREGWGHSTWEAGVRFALENKPKRLIITHHDVMNTDGTLRRFETWAQEVYPNTMFARVGDKFLM